MIANARWYLCVPVALVALLFVDLLLRLWNPQVPRLPEQFSAPFLERFVRQQSGSRPVVFLGDSVLWGYRLPWDDATPSILRAQFPDRRIVNLSYEGGSSANSYFMLKYLLANHVRPALVVFNVNSKETNSADSAYKRLHPALEANVLPLLDPDDRQLLNLAPPPGLAQKLELAVSRVWTLYRYRTDLREAIFGTSDAATAFTNVVQRYTGSAALQAFEHQPTPDRFLGTYDLEPLTPANVDFTYLKKLGALLHSEGIPGVAVLTPTNHVLLHDYIDVAEYDAKLTQLGAALTRSRITVLNFDRAIPAREFLDNDHLTPVGNRRFAALLSPPMAKELRK